MDHRAVSLPLALIVGLQPVPASEFVEVTHQPVGCVVADKFPRFEARLLPADRVGVARVFFQGATSDWYSVAMKKEGDGYAAILPKPKKDLKSVRYYIEVIGQGAQSTRTPEHVASVVGSASACKGVIGAALASASVIVQGPAGVAALPAGFASTGVIAGSASASGAASGTAAAGGSSASGAAGAGAGAAAGGGIGATALVVGGLAAGGAVAVGVAAKGGDDGGNGGSGGNNPSNNISLTISFLPLPGIDISVCGPGLSTFNAQGVNVNSSGTFNDTWSPSTPNVVRATGSASATSLQANISCTNGARSGTITATGSNYSMSGTFEFGPSRGQVTVTRQN